MKWISIKEELPLKDVLILVSDGKNFGYIWGIDREGLEDYADESVPGIPDSSSGDMKYSYITHWAYIKLPEEYLEEKCKECDKVYENITWQWCCDGRCFGEYIDWSKMRCSEHSMKSR